MTDAPPSLASSPYSLPSRMEALVAACARRAQKEGDIDLARIVARARIEVDEAVDHDNWDGGQDGHADRLLLEEDDFHIADGRGPDLRTDIRDRMNAMTKVPGEFISRVQIALDLDKVPLDWRSETGFLPSPTLLAQSSADTSKRLWGEAPLRVFLSHRAEFKVETKQLKDELARYGVAAFVAHEDIEPTLSWQEEIERALSSAHTLVALLSPGFRTSCWTQQEIGVALGRGIPVFSLKFGEDPTGFVGRYQAIPAQLGDSMNSCARELAHRFAQERALSVAAVHALVIRWEGVRSYRDAARLAHVLSSVDEISDELLNRMVAAFKVNDQIHGASYAKDEFVSFRKRVRPQPQTVKS